MITPEDADRLGEHLMPSADFNKLLGYNLKTVKKIKSKSPIPPYIMLVLDREGDERFPAAILDFEDMPDGDARLHLLYSCGAKAAREGLKLVAAFFVSEAFMRMVDRSKEGADEEAKEAAKKGLRHDPLSKEAVVVCGRTLDGRTNMATLLLDRSGKKLVFGEEMITEYQKNDTSRKIEDPIMGAFFQGYMQTLRSLLLGGKMPPGMGPKMCDCEGGCGGECSGDCDCGGSCGANEEGEEWKKGCKNDEDEDEDVSDGMTEAPEAHETPSTPEKPLDLSDLDDLPVAEQNSPFDPTK